MHGFSSPCALGWPSSFLVLLPPPPHLFVLCAIECTRSVTCFLSMKKSSIISFDGSLHHMHGQRPRGGYRGRQ